jgi:Mg2+ and Co2+ transporter CorA
VHASNLEPARIEEIARATGVSKSMIDAALGESSYPRLEPGRTWTALSFSLPGGAGRRDPVLLLATDDDVLSMSAHPTDLHAAIGAPPEGGPWGPRVVIGALRLVLQRHEESVGRFERELRTLEETPAGESGESFFEQTFVLKRRTSAAKADLWRLHGLLRAVAEGRRALPGLGAEGKAAIDRLEDEADYLHETVEDIREGLLTLIDLHLNVASHDANRFMRLLAIVSTLALIPAIVGGLLGMNLTDNPWPVTLGQVAFGTLMVMLGVLYAFLAKGWIR